jgi:hypothetical protein
MSNNIINSQESHLQRENAKWSRDEEIELIKNIAGGSSCSELVTKMQRKENALNLRLKKIIYEYIQKGKGISELSKYLNLSEDVINQHYYSYKDRIDKSNKNNGELDKSYNQNTQILTHPLNSDNSIIHNQVNHKHVGGQINNIVELATQTKFNNINKLEEENKIMKTIIENNSLKKNIKEMFVKKKLSSSEKRVLKQLFKK